MTTTLTRTATPPVVDLDTRLAITDAAMDALLDQAALVFEVNTAHLPEPTVGYVAPILPTLDPAPAPQPSPLAAVYLGAIQILRERGWARGALREGEAVCVVGAIRAAVGPANRGLADDACTHLLEVIKTQFARAESVPSWNDSQRNAAAVLRVLSQAATRADSGGI